MLALLFVSCAKTPAPPEVAVPDPVPAEEVPVLEIDRLPEDHPHGGSARSAAAIDMVVIHTVGGQVCEDGEVTFSPAGRDAVFWRDWFETQGGKSIHYVVGREGDIAQQRPELRTAGHVAFNGVVEDVNARSIGIELVNRGDGVDPFPEAQLDALSALVAGLATRYDIGPDELFTHAELDTRMLEPPCNAHRRNVDPGSLFDMERLRAHIRPLHGPQ